MWKIDSCKQPFCTLSTEEIGRVKVQAGKGCLPVAALLVALLLCKMSMFKCMYLSFSRTLCWSTMLKKKKKVFSLVFFNLLACDYVITNCIHILTCITSAAVWSSLKSFPLLIISSLGWTVAPVLAPDGAAEPQGTQRLLSSQCRSCGAGSSYIWLLGLCWQPPYSEYNL